MFCVACGGQVDGDAFCRKCGRATSTVAPRVTVENVYHGKNLQIAGSVASLVGVFTCFSSCAANDSYDAGHMLGIGGLVLVAGLVLVMVGKYQHWYHAE